MSNETKKRMWIVRALRDSEASEKDIHIGVMAPTADEAEAAVIGQNVMGDGWPAIDTIISVIPLR